ncbi:NAD(P)/FAD-dependent oxidoreductase [Tsukamurella sp. 8F]|uniref:NAD(P)/FAD-dependent oxidoreductase n=1 Tax=unclassified Tsukamurella TaxID=2633480 RepID=UPI0023B8DCD1|nr:MULTISPECIES: NAD(P)/FAD-dependent oxidoreductase [unclassified Tsukamurella]MDF0531688.1 NAD(P)/FAD-dependent oxidoreductase [Tsukamurella sp. 8J]MDF0588934.1 NAD(P)/FAD-dependent oxidoreductase [Tsukamurella sp. 8F]
MARAAEAVSDSEVRSTDVDVAILGGGIAGLTLALQLKRALPDLDVLVIEREAHPVPEAAHKVGESSVEMQAHYLRDVLGLQAHLENDHLRKFGLRIFFPHGDNSDIAERVEFGQVEEAPLATYQLDRGRLENYLARAVADLGVRFHDNSRVRHVELGEADKPHRVEMTDHTGSAAVVNARWAIDASGRAALLKRQLGLAKPVGHKASSAWFRIGHQIAVDDWSSDPDWQARANLERGPYGRKGGPRYLSTNHLMGPGYWVWLIPLASGATSIGIVADGQMHPPRGFNTRDRALAWLDAHEPQCAAAIRRHQDAIKDFRVMTDYAYSSKAVYSPHRWCLTGEAGVSIDPLYSSGGDLMGISNGLITDLIQRDFAGEDITEQVVAHNQVYLVLSEIWLVAYDKQYPLMGNAQVMVAKVIWDTIMYWAVPGLLFFHEKIPRLGDSAPAMVNLMRAWKIHERVQKFYREWHSVDNEPAARVFADPYTLMKFIVDLHEGMDAGLPDAELERQFDANVRLLEQIAGQLADTVVASLSRSDDPATVAQVASWEADSMLSELRALHLRMSETNPIDDAWITLGRQSPSLA